VRVHYLFLTLHTNKVNPFGRKHLSDVPAALRYLNALIAVIRVSCFLFMAAPSHTPGIYPDDITPSSA